jgi:uncharacterized membrane protein YbhN (UPF0104 family)
VTQFASQDLRRLQRSVAASVLLFALGTAVAAALLGGRGILDHLARVTPGLLGALLALSLVNYAARALRWHVFARRLGLTIPLGRSSVQYVAGFALTTTPAKMGEALRLWLMARADGVPYRRSIPILVADRVVDLCAVGVLLLISAAGASAHPVLVATAAAALSGTLLLGLRPGIAVAAVDVLYGLSRRWARRFVQLRGIVRDTAALVSPGLFGIAMLLSVVGWLAECLAFALVLDALGAEVGLVIAVLAFSASMLAGALSFLPGGLGGAEAAMLVVLAAAGVPMEVAVPATVVIRVTTLWFAVALGFAALAPAMRRTREAAA